MFSSFKFFLGDKTGAAKCGHEFIILKLSRLEV